MDDTTPCMTTLFQQLGLDENEEAIAAFIRTHQLPADVSIAQAPFWNVAQRQFLADRLVAHELSIARKVGDNDVLYGSVTNGDIGDLLKAKGFDVDRRKILLPDPLRALGEALVPVKLHRDVTAQLKITIVKE